MPIYLKQSTASQEVPLGYFVDSADGDTAETGLTINNTDIKVWKSGATTLADKNSGGATHIAGGIYYAVLDATDTDTLGPLVLFVHVAGALTVRLECVVLAANIYDSLIGATDNLQVDTTQLSGDGTAADNAEAFFDGTGYAGTNNVIPTVTTVTNAVSANVTQLSGDSTAADNAESFFDGTGYAGTNNVIPTVTTLTNAPGDSTGVTELLTRLPDASPGANGGLPVLNAALEVPKVKAVSDAVIVGTISAGAIDAAAIATNAIDADALALDAVNEIADGVWDEATAGHVAGGSTGKALTDANNGTPPTADAVADQVWDELIAGHAGAGSTGAALSGASAPSAATVADAVWDEALAGHAGAGSTGAALSGASAPSAATVADAVWDESSAAHLAAGSTGLVLSSLAPGAAIVLNADITEIHAP